MTKENYLISLILPTYNESGNIIPLIKAVQRSLHEYNYEVIVVDDDSPDQTAKMVSQHFTSHKKIRLFVRRTDKGLAKAIRYGIEKSNGDFILVMDTDFNHHPTDIPRLFTYSPQFDLVIGSRYIRGGGMEDKLRYWLSLFYNLAVSFLLHLSTHDNLSGFFLIKKHQLEKFDYDKIFTGYGDYFIRLLKAAHLYNLKIKEVPVFYQKRLTGKSKSRLPRMFIDYSKTVIKILCRNY